MNLNDSPSFFSEPVAFQLFNLFDLNEKQCVKTFSTYNHILKK